MSAKIRIRIIVFILLLVQTPGFTDIAEARKIYNEGDFIEALNIYDDWLENNHDSADFSSVLFEISELSGDIYKISGILEKQIIFVPDRDKRKSLFKRLAQFYDLSADLKNAQVYYQKAALISLEGIDYEILLDSARILLLEGEFLLAESQLEEIILNCTDQNISAKAKLFFTILKILESNSNIDYSISPVDKPESIYLMYLIAKTESDTVKIDLLSEKLVKDFESSPEAGLFRNELSELPDIITSLGLLNSAGLYAAVAEKLNTNVDDTTFNYMIQAGSFKDPENAHYLSLDLKEEGFVPIVEEQIVNKIEYYKVLLYFLTKEKMNNALSLLKEKGFEGFPVY